MERAHSTTRGLNQMIQGAEHIVAEVDPVANSSITEPELYVRYEWSNQPLS